MAVTTAVWALLMVAAAVAVQVPVEAPEATLRLAGTARAVEFDARVTLVAAEAAAESVAVQLAVVLGESVAGEQASLVICKVGG